MLGLFFDILINIFMLLLISVLILGLISALMLDWYIQVMSGHNFVLDQFRVFTLMLSLISLFTVGPNYCFENVLVFGLVSILTLCTL